ncbi:hypothetical protein M3Y98_00798800 [Aphelenchoides besseyi]|nr:hypothetical protein M3Y98_00798800 [Aphelenchoides besseyi]
MADDEDVAVVEHFIKRPVVIDGCNLMYLLGTRTIDRITMNRRKQSACGLLLLVHQLLTRGFEPLIVLKRFFENDDNVHDHFIVTHLMEFGLIEIVDDHIDDDLFMLKKADEIGAAIVSNDQYREAKYRNYSSRSRLIDIHTSKLPNFNFYVAATNREHRFNFNLKLKLKASNKNAQLCPSTDPLYPVLLSRSNKFLQRRRLLIKQCELLSDFLQQRRCNSYNYVPPSLPYFNSTFRVPSSFQFFRKMHDQWYELYANRLN